MVAGNGGIARVARLIARVTQETLAGTGSFDATVLLDPACAPHEFQFAVASAQKSRLRFFASVHAAALRHSHFIYDFVGMSRAHNRIPGLDRPFMTYLHGVEIWDRSRQDRVRWARRAARLLTNSRYTLDRAQETHGPFAQASVCWLATETDDPPAAITANGTRPRILFCGRVADAYKGHAELIACWPQVLTAVPDAELVIAGRDSDKLGHLVTRAGCPDRVVLRGFVPEHEMDALYASATAFAMPSRGEGFGLVYIEAMRHGLPIIASVHDAAQEITLDGQTGYNVDLDRPGQLAERIIELLRDRDHARQMGAQAQQRWAQHFRFSAFKERFVPHLQRFLGGLE